MGSPAARQNDSVTGIDVHVVLVPVSGGSVPTLLPHPFAGPLNGALSPDVFVNGLAAAVVGSHAGNYPPHVPTPPGTAFQTSPKNRGTVFRGSATVYVNGKPVARAGDPVMTCNDPVDGVTSVITAGSPTVSFGG